MKCTRISLISALCVALTACFGQPDPGIPITQVEWEAGSHPWGDDYQNGLDGGATGRDGTDGGGTDGGATDGSGTDGGGTDGGATDGGGTDGSGTDGGATDGSGTDGGGTDGGATDGGGTDGGGTDGGDSDGGGGTIVCSTTFEPQDACGGDLSGSWSMSNICIDVDPETLIETVCPAASIFSIELDGEGTMEFKDDDTLRRIFSWEFELNLFVPGSSGCVPLTGCSSVAAQLHDVFNDGTVECVPVGFQEPPSCNCLVSISRTFNATDVVTDVSDDTYTVDAFHDYQYCVDEENLTVRSEDGQKDYVFIQKFVAD